MYRKIIPPTESDAIQFWSLVDIGGKNDCWEWLGARDEDAYGYFSYAGETWSAHRIAYLLYYGPFDERLYVCHHCDWKHCVSPHCLFLGTARDNFHNAMEKGRIQTRVGIETGVAVLTDKTATEALKIYKAGETSMAMLAKMFGVKQPTISCLINRQTWRHLNIPNVEFRKRCRGEQIGNSKLTEESVKKIRKDYGQNLKIQSQLAEEYGVHQSTIWGIIHRKIWNHIA